MYDICSCVVALGGDVRQTVPKPIVTVPEILLLQSIHGGETEPMLRLLHRQLVRS